MSRRGPKKRGSNDRNDRSQHKGRGGRDAGRGDVYIACGINVINQLMEHQPDRLLELYLIEDMGSQRQHRLKIDPSAVDVPVNYLSDDDLLRLTGSENNQGVAARIKPPHMLDDNEALEHLEGIESPLILILDSVQDPRNFGACLRTAESAGVDLVVVPRSRSVDMTPTVSKVASGAAETQKIARVTNLARFMRELQELGIRLMGTDDEGDGSLYQHDVTGPMALVMGAEGTGMRRLTRENCDFTVNLPMLGTVESLNLSVATGICLYEILRQRGSS
jgi:23S rRNA (guanosine2251-2'-O)-methyltransferase